MQKAQTQPFQEARSPETCTRFHGQTNRKGDKKVLPFPEPTVHTITNALKAIVKFTLNKLEWNMILPYH